MNDDLLPVKGSPRRYLNLVVALLLAAGTITLLLRDERPVSSDLTPDLPADRVAAPPADAPLFRVGDQTFSYATLAPEFQEPIYQIRKMAHEQQMLVLEQALLDSYIAQQMAQRKQDRETVLQQLFPDAAPSPQDLEAFYRANQTPDTPPFSQIRGQLETYLTEQNREALKQTLLARLLVEGEVEMLVEAPQPPARP